MTGSALVYEQPRAARIETLEDALFDAFLTVRDALSEGRSVVVIVRDEDVLGHGEVADAALAGGLIGMTKALAIEGARAEWRINAISASVTVTEAERASWVARLSDPEGVCGEVIRLGALHLGRVPV